MRLWKNPDRGNLREVVHMFNNILTATDVVTMCNPAVLAAADLAKKDESSLSVLHVLESTYSGKYRNYVKHFATGEEIVSDDDYERAVEAQIGKHCAKFLKPLGRYEIQIRTGFPWEQILKWARDKKVGLIVLGPHSRRAQARGVTRVVGNIGSTVEGVIMHERCPVMIVNRPLKEETFDFRKTMVCVDFSKSCESALEFAVKLAQKHKAKLFVFHMMVPTTPSEESEETPEEKIRFLTQRLADFGRLIPTEIQRENTVQQGTLPHREIIEFARDHDVDLVVMGSHTKDKADKWYVGSAVEQVSLQSPCPVVVVTDPAVLRKVKA
jgi:nucleotide-binding universal stress UspA family protein